MALKQFSHRNIYYISQIITKNEQVTDWIKNEVLKKCYMYSTNTLQHYNVKYYK